MVDKENGVGALGFETGLQLYCLGIKLCTDSGKEKASPGGCRLHLIVEKQAGVSVEWRQTL